LQKKGFTVLTFDFRGHGESTNVTPETFWKVSQNSNLIRGAKPNRKTIRQSDFQRSYTPMLVNDISAAKRYLDQKNDEQLCNSSNLIVIGAEEGAALGTLWIYTEWDHWPRIKNAFNVWIRDPQGKLLGEDIAAAIWFSPVSSLNGKSVGDWLKDKKEIREKIPMVFFASKEDQTGAAVASRLFEDLKRQSKLDLTFAELVKGGKAHGVDLVNKKELNVPDQVCKYLEKVIDKRRVNAWKMRDPEKVEAVFVPLSRYGFTQLN
jgi:hypothetical protein